MCPYGGSHHYSAGVGTYVSEPHSWGALKVGEEGGQISFFPADRKLRGEAQELSAVVVLSL